MDATKTSIKDALMATMDIPREFIEFAPGLSAWVYGWSALEIDQWRQEIESKGFNKDYLSATLFQRSLRDVEGKRIYATTDIPKLATMSGQQIQRVIKVLNRLNGYGEDEQLSKNSLTQDQTEPISGS